MSILITTSVDCEHSGNRFDMISTFTNDLCELYKIRPNYLVPNLNSAVYKKPHIKLLWKARHLRLNKLSNLSCRTLVAEFDIDM